MLLSMFSNFNMKKIQKVLDDLATRTEAKRKLHESKLAVVAINDGTNTTLITEHGRYVISNGNLVKAERVESYEVAVKEELKQISERLAIGASGGKYTITYDGKLNFPLNRLV